MPRSDKEDSKTIASYAQAQFRAKACGEPKPPQNNSLAARSGFVAERSRPAADEDSLTSSEPTEMDQQGPRAKHPANKMMPEHSPGTPEGRDSGIAP